MPSSHEKISDWEETEDFIRSGDTILLVPAKGQGYLSRIRSDNGKQRVVCSLKPEHFEESCVWVVKSPFKEGRPAICVGDEVQISNAHSGELLSFELGETSDASMGKVPQKAKFQVIRSFSFLVLKFNFLNRR